MSFSSLMVVSPIGWSGSCRRMMSSSTSIPHEFAKRIACFRAATGIVQCLLSLSHRALGNEVFRALTSSLSYGVSRMSLLPWRYSRFIYMFMLYVSST